MKEALAVGLPVVSTDVGDVAEMLDGVTPGGVVPWPAADCERRRLARPGWPTRTWPSCANGRRSDGREKRGVPPAGGGLRAGSWPLYESVIGGEQCD